MAVQGTPNALARVRFLQGLPSAKSVQIGCGAPASFGAPLHCPTFYACMRPFALHINENLLNYVLVIKYKVLII